MNKFDIIFLDWDDTIWSRKANENKEELETSIDNVKLLNKLTNYTKVVIISGNTFESICKKLLTVYENFRDIKFDIWADSNSYYYVRGTHIDSVNLFAINEYCKKICSYLKNNYNIDCELFGYPFIVNIKIKPLNNLERNLLCDLLNQYIFPELKISESVIAHKTGKTTIDILSKYNSKSFVLNTYYKNLNNTLYIGDECDDGNDSEVCKVCSEYINVDSIKRTNSALRDLIYTFTKEQRL